MEITHVEEEADKTLQTPRNTAEMEVDSVFPPTNGSEKAISSVMKLTETDLLSDPVSGISNEKISVSNVVINLNKVLEESEKSAVEDMPEPKESNSSSSNVNSNKSSGFNNLVTGGSILAKYISEARQRSALSTGSLQLQRNLHLLERNNVQITEKQGHMLNNSVSIYPSKPRSVDSANPSESGNSQGNLLGRMHGIVQNVGNQSNQGYRVNVPMQHFMPYHQRMVSPYSMPQHVSGHVQMQGMRPGHLQLQERSNPPPLLSYHPQGQLQIQRHAVFQDRIMQMNMQNKMQQVSQLMPRMAVQMQYPSYYSVPNRFPNSLSPTSGRERPLSDPRSVNVDRISNVNLHPENFERYPRSYSEPHEETNRINSDPYQQDLYHGNTYSPATFQREPSSGANEIFYRSIPVASDRQIDMYQSRASHGESSIRHTPEKQKEGGNSGHGMSTLDAAKVVTKQEFVENIDEAALDDTVEEFVDFERAANLNVFTEQHDERPHEETENYDDNMSIGHFLQVDYSDNANDQIRQDEQQEQQQGQIQGQPLYQMNRPKTIIFKCKYCKKKFFHKRELEKHMISHSTYTRVRNDGKRRDFPCTLCDCSYIRKTHLERHMLSHMRKQDQYKCVKCNYFFVHRRHLEIHNLQVHSGKSEAEIRFDEQVQIVSVDPNAPDFGNESRINIVKVKEEMIENIDTRPNKPFHKHSNVSRSFFCQHCGRAFLKNQYLRAHIRNFHDGNFSETTASQLSVNRPFNPFTQQKKLFCPVCGQGFIKMKYFRSHWNKFHEQDHETRTDPTQKTNPVPLSAPPPPLVKKPFVCHICNNGFYHPQNLKRHIRDVHYKKKIENKESQSVPNHPDGSSGNTSGEKDVEGSASKLLTPALKKKISRGSRGSRAFCPICTKEFLYEYNVRRHIRNVHPDFIGMAPVKTRPVPMSGPEDQDEDQDTDQHEQEQDQSITLSNLSNINESQLMGWNMDDGNGQNPSTSQATEERPFKCTLCDKRFYRMLFLKRHFGTSHGMSHPDTTEADWSFECRACGKRFARNDSLIRHMKMKHRKLYRTVRAEKIRQNYASASNAEAEKMLEDSEPKTSDELDNDSQNEVRGETDNTRETETDPFEGVHSQDSQETPTVTPKLTIFRCGTCNITFSTKLEYVKHQRKHEAFARQRKHKCKICNFKFSQFTHLRRHMNTVHATKQTGATKKCTKCAFTATNNIALSNHMRAHTREEASINYSIRQQQLQEIEDQDDQEFEIPIEDDIESQVEAEIGNEFGENTQSVEGEMKSQYEEFEGYEEMDSQLDEDVDNKNEGAIGVENSQRNSRRQVRPVKRNLARGSRRSRAFCPICSKEFMYEYNVKRHIQNAHPECKGMAPVKTRPVPMSLPDNQEQQEDQQDQEQDTENMESGGIENQNEDFEGSPEGEDETEGLNEGMENTNEEDIESQPDGYDEDIENKNKGETKSLHQEEDDELESQVDEEMENTDVENTISEPEGNDDMFSQLHEGMENTNQGETESLAKEGDESSQENVNDNLAETFNESLAKRLDETLAETMADALDENTEENIHEHSDGETEG